MSSLRDVTISKIFIFLNLNGREKTSIKFWEKPSVSHPRGLVSELDKEAVKKLLLLLLVVGFILRIRFWVQPEEYYRDDE